MVNIKKYLLCLLKNQYNKKQVYFIFEKSNGNKFIITNASGQFNHLGIGEITKDNKEIDSYIYGFNINNCTFFDNNRKYNPIERLAEKCNDMKYIKTIIDKRILIEDYFGNKKIPICQWNWALKQVV